MNRKSLLLAALLFGLAAPGRTQVASRAGRLTAMFKVFLLTPAGLEAADCLDSLRAGVSDTGLVVRCVPRSEPAISIPAAILQQFGFKVVLPLPNAQALGDVVAAEAAKGLDGRAYTAAVLVPPNEIESAFRSACMIAEKDIALRRALDSAQRVRRQLGG